MMLQVLVIDVVEVRPGRHFDDGDAAWTEDSRHLAYGFSIVVDVLEHVEQNDCVNTGGWKRTTHQVELEERYSGLLVCQPFERLLHEVRTDERCRRPLRA